RQHEGRFGAYVTVQVSVVEVTGRGAVSRVRSPVLVIGDPSWVGLRLGAHIVAAGRLQTAEGGDLAAVLVARGGPELTRPPGAVDRAVSRVRGGLTEAAAPLPPAERALVPALVDGDDSAMPDQVRSDFKTAGLTHLLAVSGSNLTLVLAFALLGARWAGVRGYGLALVGALAVGCFVLLARPEPSVLRAAAMGVVGLAGLAAGGARRGTRALCVAVVVLMLVDPWMARSVGFCLSTFATAGILLLAPPCRDALARWMPRPIAEAIAIPLSAQVVCTPVIAAISGQVSLVAVIANLLAGPAVGPATVTGLVAGLIALVSADMGHLVARVAALPAWWIIWVAEHSARLAGAAVEWPVGAASLALLTGLCIVLVVVLPRLLSRRGGCLVVTCLLLLVVVHPPARLGWPPDGWVLVMCDVGQGDGMVLNAGPHAGVVVDTGPDPIKMGRCLDELAITTVPLVVLTHFHADHVTGLPAVIDGRQVGEIEVSPLSEPAAEAERVRALAAAARIPVKVAVPGEHRTVGAVRFSVLGPLDVSPGGTSTHSGDEGAGPNNASVVMSVRSHGLRLLMTGDAEPEEEDDIMASGAGLSTDVFKVAHHGSSHQDPSFILASHAPLAIISVGAGNDYGHPAPQTLGWLRELGARVYRTDLDGDIAVLNRGGQLLVSTTK
ncbi:MAG: ComEC/Rec2 family competence protein, partial [Nocardioidaceae bacterium]